MPLRAGAARSACRRYLLPSILEIGCSIQPAATNRQLGRPLGNHDAPAAIKRIGANAMADIFISYTAADRDWAFWIAKELEALGHIPHVHEWEIERGGDIYAWMEQRHDTADHVLCVVSDDYLKAPYSTLERNAALWQKTAGSAPARATRRAQLAARFAASSMASANVFATVRPSWYSAGASSANVRSFGWASDRVVLFRAALPDGTCRRLRSRRIRSGECRRRASYSQ